MIDVIIPEFQTEHNLSFECAPYELNIDPNNFWMKFRIGTCDGLWCSTDKTYNILAIDNRAPGNGHFEDVLQWFEYSCKRDNKSFQIMELYNQSFKTHLINKRGFSKTGDNNLIKHFKP